MRVPAGRVAGRGTLAEPSAASVARPSSVPSAFFTTTVPVGAVPVDPSRETVTLAEEAWPALDGSGTCVAATLVATLQMVTFMLSTHQPVMPPQPSRPMSKRNCDRVTALDVRGRPRST